MKEHEKVPENGVGNCVHYRRPLKSLERCVSLGVELANLETIIGVDAPILNDRSIQIELNVNFDRLLLQIFIALSH